MKLQSVAALLIGAALVVPFASASTATVLTGQVRHFDSEGTCFANLVVTFTHDDSGVTANINVLPTSTGTNINPHCQTLAKTASVAVDGDLTPCTKGAVVSGAGFTAVTTSCHSSQPRGYADVAITLGDGATVGAASLAFAFA